MIRSAVLAITNRSVTRKLVTDTPVGKSVAHRFVAGTELAEAIAVAESLNAEGLKVSLDYLGEHVTVVEEADSATESYLECIEAIAEHGLDANISVKLTQLGMGLDNDAAAANLDAIAASAAKHGTTVTVDMEESAHTEATVAMYEPAQKRHGNLGIAIQAYLHRSWSDVERLIPLGGHIRICKGAYVEPSEVAMQSGSEIDASFDALTGLLMASEGPTPAIATHDDARIGPAINAAAGRSLPWEFQMLYGVRRDRQAQLVTDGHDMRVYVPYGEAWYPYLTRRLAERPANLTFFARALVGK
jgi:proline dehydrogenase